MLQFFVEKNMHSIYASNTAVSFFLQKIDERGMRIEYHLYSKKNTYHTFPLDINSIGYQ